jgi:hypothetical protein
MKTTTSTMSAKSTKNKSSKLLCVLGVLGGLLLCGADRPPIELPIELRHANYGREGSCAYAAAEDLLSLQGRQDLARYVRQHYSGGVMPSPGHGCRALSEVAEALDLDYDYTDRGDEQWLQCASDQGLGAVVHWAETGRKGQLDYGVHAATFLGFDGDGLAWYLNSNDPKTCRHRPKAEFLDIWRKSGGDAFTFVLHPKE